MMKYIIPTIKIESFLSENIVTESKLNNEYIPEVTALMNNTSQERYKARVESVNNILQFNTPSGS